MYFLVTGASGVGKSTVRRLLEPEFTGVIEIAELGMLGRTPRWEIEWRHQMVEKTVQRALEAQREGRHYLLCGDPVPPGEVLAAPSADRLDRLYVCLLDAVESVQTSRLLQRGDEPRLIAYHVAFADWMRRHVVDHRHRPDVITQNGWPPMRWDRWVGTSAAQPPWSPHIIDTSELGPSEVAQSIAQWLRQRLHAGRPEAKHP